MDQRVILFFGKSGSGKGTRAQLLEDYFNKNDPSRKVLRIETGAGLRKLAEQENYTGRRVKESLKIGGLMPEFLPIWTWGSFLVENYTGTEHILMDGLARRAPEAPTLESALRFYELEKNTRILYIETSDEWSMQRLLERKRADDAEENIRARLSWFKENVLASLEYFENIPDIRFERINGEQSVGAVHRDILTVLE